MPVNRNTFFSSGAGSFTTSTATFSSAMTTPLTFTPKASTTYFILASSIIDGTGTFIVNKWRLQNITVPTTLSTFDSSNNSGGGCGHAIVQWTSTTATPNTFDIQHEAFSGGGSITTSFGTLLAIEKGPNDSVATNSSTVTNTSTSSFSTSVTHTFTVPSTGNYLIMAFAEVADNSGSSGGVTVKLNQGGTDYGLLTFSDLSNTFVPWSTVVRKNLSAGSQTATIQFHSGGDTASCRNSNIIAIRMDDFYNEYYQEIRTSQANTLVNTIQTVPSSTLTQTTTAFDHITIGSSQYNPNNNGNGRNLISVNGATKGSSTGIFFPQSYCYFFPWKETLSAASHTYFFQQENGASKDTAISLFQVTGIPTNPTGGSMILAF